MCNDGQVVGLLTEIRDLLAAQAPPTGDGPEDRTEVTGD